MKSSGSFYRFTVLILFCISFAFPGNVLAGWLVTGKYIDTDGKTYLHKIYIEGRFIKVERYNMIYVCDLQSGDMILVDPEALLYCKCSFDEYADESRKLMEDRLVKLLADVPITERDEVRAVNESFIRKIGTMPGPLQDSLQFVKTRDTLVMSGYRTEKYILNTNGRKKQEVWFAPSLGLKDDMPWEKFLPFLVLLEGSDKLVQIMNSPLYMQMLQGGYPMRMMMYENGTKSEWQVNKVEKMNIPDYEFYTPVMCKKITVSEWLSRVKKSDYQYDDYE